MTTTQVYGISSEYDYYELSLDSQDATNSNSTVTSSLNWPVFDIGGGTQSLSNVVGLKVISAEIPFTYYVFNTLNNSFKLFEIGGAIGTSTTITIPVGNYTTNTLSAALGLAMSAANSPNACTYTITYSNLLNKLVFTNTPAGGVTSFKLQFLTAEDNTSCFQFLGLKGGDNFSTGLTLTTPNSILLSGPNYAFINSRKYGQLTNNILPTGARNLGGGTRGPQLASVPITGGPGDIIAFDDKNPHMFFSIGTSNQFQEIDLYITIGNYSQVVDFNGIGFSVKLGLIIQRDTADFSGTGGMGSGRVVKRSRPL